MTTILPTVISELEHPVLWLNHLCPVAANPSNPSTVTVAHRVSAVPEPSNSSAYRRRSVLSPTADVLLPFYSRLLSTFYLPSTFGVLSTVAVAVTTAIPSTISVSVC